MKHISEVLASNPIARRAMIEMRKEEYPAGTRVRAVKFAPSGIVDDNETVRPGTEGTAKYQDSLGTIFVEWDNGRRLGVVLEDQIEKVEING
jgi:hypothetical protein